MGMTTARQMITVSHNIVTLTVVMHRDKRAMSHTTVNEDAQGGANDDEHDFERQCIRRGEWRCTRLRTEMHAHGRVATCGLMVKGLFVFF
ncbi:hypothetical protein SESBI_17058 [Sesbania bispinosa]|nr:hypothetical protein SESBI_17058 [Sesbania bispinosa]